MENAVKLWLRYASDRCGGDGRRQHVADSDTDRLYVRSRRANLKLNDFVDAPPVTVLMMKTIMSSGRDKMYIGLYHFNIEMTSFSNHIQPFP